MICKQLGYPRAIRFTRESEFGQVSPDFAMDNVDCRGAESSILDCTYLTEDNCGAGEGAGVVCDDLTTNTNSTTEATMDIWLEGGYRPNEGNIMVRLPNGEVGPVCDDTFSDD